MSDLDFDELDRAVNSLISKAPTTDTTVKNDDNQNDDLFISSDIKLDDNDLLKTSDIESDEKVERPVFKSLAGQRSSGRFMDVIHPSSDMRNATSKSETTTPLTVSATSKPSTQTPKPLLNPIINDIPNKKSSDSDSEIEEIFKETKLPSVSALESPFIAGAKVEKRPLGAFSSDTIKSEIELSPTGEVNEKTDKFIEYEKTEKEVDDQLPEEFQEDLLKIESVSSKQTEEKETEKATEKDDIPEFEKDLDLDKPVQIVQQYKENKPDANKKSGAIYDTNVYHKAPELEEKKKSGWLWVLWIFLLILVGVGAGVVAYFFVLPIFK